MMMMMMISMLRAVGTMYSVEVALIPMFALD